MQSENYDRILRELEELRKKQENSQQQQPPVIVNPPADYAALVERVMPSMVFIETSEGRGSGFFVSPNGGILTNYHVIDNAAYITVTTQNGQSFNALLKDYDSVRDMAFLKVDLQKSAPFLTISSNTPRKGETVIAIGTPKA